MPIAQPFTQHCGPLTFTAYPSCEDCLAWSEEGLALAGGENIHIVKVGANSDKQSAISTFRVDQFNNQEWPEQGLATFQHFSVGEEQSNSVVVALAWSPPGLGIHHRPVLAVLTSNLLLSLWETDGSQRNWRRTCVVNQHLPLSVSSQIAHNAFRAGRARRYARIRCLAWSDPLRVFHGGKRGLCFLSVLDDDDNLTVLQVDKKSKDQYGFWSMKTVFTSALSQPEFFNSDAAGMTDLQELVILKASVKRMLFLSWDVENLPSAVAQTVVRTSIVYQRHHQNTQFAVHLEFNLLGHDSEITARQIESQEFRDTTLENRWSFGRQDFGIIHRLEDRPQWQETLKDIVAEYNSKHRLGGLFRIRFWGIVLSPDQDTEAACVTLHPWDMYEYTSNVLEKCHLVFRTVQNQSTAAFLQQKTANEVMTSVLDFVVTELRSRTEVISTIDQAFVRVLHAWTARNPDRSHWQAVLEASVASRSKSEQTVVDGSDVSGDDFIDAQTILSKPFPPTIAAPETCDICGTPIDMSDDSNSSNCVNGHVFSRCSLSLMSIQEPGISKYCSGCDRQFLNMSKLKPQPGQCLTSKLFDEFDVCPYCRGKFRG
ncbi:hypothetical protein H2198_002679 [Neophaeococcomyces mojaviensis]|uniref:Uncharacterized protein n=1 Tax=Neophaeococcomyces mojaviensis TaxID=3383035 RepID=A0ACC3ADD5_9EURO|nr:hypothetical protein H2198_002679 [Knufia sp. JES_112]